MMSKRKAFDFIMRLWESVLRLLFPPRCLKCGCFTENEALCPDCLPDYQLDRMHLCPDCGFPQCDCQCPVPGFSGERLYQVSGYRPGRREDISSVLLFALKEGDRDTVSMIGADLAEALRELPDFCTYTVTWVPRRRQAIRDFGCDQSRLLAKEVSRQLGIPCYRLIKRVGGREQKKLTPAERKRNAAASYAAVSEAKTRKRNGSAIPAVLPDRVILIDDLATTGATLAVCARLLRDTGVKTVVPAVFARTLRGAVR